jgi:hypothetical protein
LEGEVEANLGGEVVARNSYIGGALKMLNAVSTIGFRINFARG